jgi:hypothetical protein
MKDLEMAIYESMMDGSIDTDSGKKMLDIYYEGVLDPIRSKLAKIKEIKDAKPKDYDGPEATKKFVDKYYNDIVNCAKILETEPDKLRKNEVTMCVASIVGILGYLPLMLIEDAGLVAAGTALSIGTGLFILGAFVLPTIHVIISYVRKSDDIKASDDLAKVRTALKKVDTVKLPKEYQNKITDCLTAIDDAETEISSRVKVSKESVMDIRLSIYEKAMTGEISESDRDMLLEALDAKA